MTAYTISLTGADYVEYLQPHRKVWLRPATTHGWHWLAWIHVQHR